jgi:hypothetical protein
MMQLLDIDESKVIRESFLWCFLHGHPIMMNGNINCPITKEMYCFAYFKHDFFTKYPMLLEYERLKRNKDKLERIEKMIVAFNDKLNTLVEIMDKKDNVQ